MTDDSAAAAERWLRAGHRTWRWNDGSYAGKNRYDAVETTDEGLLWFGFDGAVQGVSYRRRQAFEHYRQHGPLLELPPHVRSEVAAWMAQRAACVTAAGRAQ